MDHAQTEDAHMRRAIELSRQGMEQGAGFPFGAVITRGGQVVAEGFNHVFAWNDPTAHAEIVAIRLACERAGSPSLAGCTIYASGEPCPMCLAAIYWAGIERICYANDLAAAAEAGFGDAQLYQEIARPAGERAIPASQRLAAEAREVFAAWQARQP